MKQTNQNSTSRFPADDQRRRNNGLLFLSKLRFIIQRWSISEQVSIFKEEWFINLSYFLNRKDIALTGFSRSLVMLLLTVSVVSGVFGQAVRPAKGVVNNTNFDSSGIDNINLNNGNVNLTIPLASLPPIAGGKLSGGLSATYNSKLWNSYQTEVEYSPTGMGCPQSFVQSYPQLDDYGGWRIDPFYRLMLRNIKNERDYIIPQSSCDPYADFQLAGLFFKMVMLTPDGAEHEMRFEDAYPTYNGQTSSTNREFLHGYYRDASGGTNGEPTISAAKRFYSTDGSYIWGILYPNGSTTRWEMFMKDGTEVIGYADGSQRVRDTNGNQVKMFCDTLGCHIQDEGTGREIRYANRTENGTTLTEIFYQTVGGAWQTVKVVWGTTTVQGKLYNTEEFCESVGDTGGEVVSKQQTLQTELSVIREIVFPQTESGVDARKYQFQYNSDQTQSVTSQFKQNCSYTSDYTRNASYGLGEVSQITTPNGALIKYAYAWDGQHDQGTFQSASNVARNVLTQKQVVHDGETETWAYTIPQGSGFQSSVTNPDGSSFSQDSYASDPAMYTIWGGADGKGGLTYRETQSNKIMTEKHWTLLSFTGANDMAFGAYGQKIGFNPVVDAEYTTLLDDSGNKLKMNARIFQYDYNGDLLQTTAYDWFDPNSVSRDTQGVPTGVPSGATALRATSTSYYNQADTAGSGNVYAKRSLSAAPLVLGAPQEMITGDAKTRMSYDSQAYGAAPIKGNATKVSSWDNTNNAWIDVSSTYDAYGNVTSTTDPKGNVTQIFYEDSTHAMPTKTIVDPQNGSGQQVSTATYDFSTGAALSQTDINGNVSNLDYTNHLLGAVDPFGRVGTTLGPATNIGGTNKRQTVKTYYEDAARKTRTEADLFDQGDGLLKSRSTRDQLGRTVLSEKNENGASTYSISSQTVYKQMGRIVLQSNPTRGTNESTDGWTRVTNDILGRPVEVTTFSGAAQPPVSGTNGNATGTVTTAYDANATTVTDQAGKSRRSITNGIGQLTRVDEPDDNGNLGAVSSPGQATGYAYDILGNLTTVNQGVQTRTFTYNSLSRLTSATNPESGTISYVYDANGNLTTKTDARSVVTNYTYDAFNRMLARTYSDGTPNVTYTYEDANINFSKGKLTKVSSSVSETKYNSFDNLGRVLTSQQITDGTPYNFGYTYNLAGMLVEETYPSGRKVKNTFENDGDLSKVETLAQGGSYQTRAENFAYSAVGGVVSMKLGNNKWENAQFNSRMQPIQLGLGSSTTDQSLWKVNYDYGTTDNNGNVKGQTINVPSINPLVQTYTYDSLNRIKSATETQNSSQTWKQTFQYDRYGNRQFDTNNTTTIPNGCSNAQCNPTIDTANNRFTTGQGYSYDLSGNVTADAQGRTFVYDAENKQKAVSNSSGAIGTYLYDGDGKRVKKVSSDETTLFVYEASGKMIAEYLLTNSTPITPVTSYLTNDTLGSPRVITDQSGNIQSRRDFMPFGEEIIQIGNRTLSSGYQTDDFRQKFTTYERDTETDLDFAQARMYANKIGRFTSPDSIMASAKKIKPESWNRFVYCYNNPLILVDPNGEEVQALDKKAKEGILLTLPENIRKQVEKSFDKTGLLKKGSLDKIKSTNKNFLDLKKIVNEKDVSEVISSDKDPLNGENFYYKSDAEFVKESIDLQKQYGISEQEAKESAEELVKNLNPIDRPLKGGVTLSPEQSPSKRWRVIIPDGTGDASDFPKSETGTSTAHELYVHVLNGIQGKPWTHEDDKNGPVNTQTRQVEERTRKMFKNP